MSDKDELLAKFREMLQPTIDKVLAEGEAEIAAYLAKYRREIEKLDAEDAIYVSLTRASRGLEPHPQLLLAALKVLDQLLVLRAQRGQA